jgi:uncharacterized protein YcnI
MRKQLAVAAMCAGVMVAGATLGAHVTLAPAQAAHGANTRYTVHVPTEDGSPTVKVDLDLPEGVRLSGLLAVGGWTAEERRDGDRLIGLSWTVQIPSGQFGELVFTARNPNEGTELTWKVTQHFADGTSTAWTPTTKLVAAR